MPRLGWSLVSDEQKNHVQKIVDEAHEVVEDVSEQIAATSKGLIRWLVEWLGIILVALSAAFLIRAYVFQTFYIPSVSMVPTLQVGDRIIVSKLSTDFGDINRGDVIVFKHPPREQCSGDTGPNSDLVKRIIGMPGDELTSRNNTIYVNGIKLVEHWQHDPNLGSDIGYVKVPKDQYFMMGDNRPSSCDSRMWGTLPKSLIVGKVVLRIWPLSHFGHP
ncbi:MAG: signal peptidase I [Actinobacteria bacterium]|nr:signal peptidase I [Actinomycetota bacterium]